MRSKVRKIGAYQTEEGAGNDLHCRKWVACRARGVLKEVGLQRYSNV